MAFPTRRRRYDPAALTTLLGSALQPAPAADAHAADPYPGEPASGLPSERLADRVAERFADLAGAQAVEIWLREDGFRLVGRHGPAGGDAGDAGPDGPPEGDGLRPDGRLVLHGRVAATPTVAVVLTPRGRAYRGRDAEALTPVADLLAAALDARQRAGAGERLERRLLTDVGHELRTPLTVISSGWQTIADHADRLPVETRRAVAQSGLRASRRLSRLVEDLLLSARLDCDPPPLELAPVLLRPLIARTARDVGVDEGLRTDVPAGLTVYADRAQLETVLRHLLVAADEVVARESGGLATVTVRGAAWTDPLGRRLADRLVGLMGGRLDRTEDTLRLVLPAAPAPREIDLTAEPVTAPRSSPAPG